MTRGGLEPAPAPPAPAMPAARAPRRPCDGTTRTVRCARDECLVSKLCVCTSGCSSRGEPQQVGFWRFHRNSRSKTVQAFLDKQVVRQVANTRRASPAATSGGLSVQSSSDDLQGGPRPLGTAHWHPRVAASPSPPQWGSEAVDHPQAGRVGWRGGRYEARKRLVLAQYPPRTPLSRKQPSRGGCVRMEPSIPTHSPQFRPESAKMTFFRQWDAYDGGAVRAAPGSR
jgi:hypothetical protein